ncbi:phosphoribosylformylglycinamidine synthase subunit PurS [Streptomyces sp. AJS327]|uniref:phosphoribosylformylglycinamidine synthase subunit PurS n=1 Tax=Streptomyces sp. AJS327 TaxID=2545265 RepID=UPI0015DFBEDC|nr:phosphoribosylformylglycinamidine synthase subunit PurS [Streptomyces sp. AJS327]MBA0053583.1 phosphoribosylformylglycinamidine synthase subunit PurS [Streptomyces sp. AJS327]
MTRVVVEVMPKPEILDPQGQAVQRALPRLGYQGVLDVRQGKRFELEVDGPPNRETLSRVEEMAETFLANGVIENFTVRVLDAAGAEVLSTDPVAGAAAGAGNSGTEGAR